MSVEVVKVLAFKTGVLTKERIKLREFNKINLHLKNNKSKR